MTNSEKQANAELAQITAQLEAVKAENERLKAAKVRPITLKVSEKGALSLYGLGRFPVTLYKSQWGKVLGMTDKIAEFLKNHDAELKEKTSA